MLSTFLIRMVLNCPRMKTDFEEVQSVLSALFRILISELLGESDITSCWVMTREDADRESLSGELQADSFSPLHPFIY